MHSSNTVVNIHTASKLTLTIVTCQRFALSYFTLSRGFKRWVVSYSSQETLKLTQKRFITYIRVVAKTHTGVVVEQCYLDNELAETSSTEREKLLGIKTLGKYENDLHVA